MIVFNYMCVKNPVNKMGRNLRRDNRILLLSDFSTPFSFPKLCSIVLQISLVLLGSFLMYKIHEID